MFDRFTEGARRVLFFARAEVSERGALTIEPEHLLLGILKTRNRTVRTILSTAPASLANIRIQLDSGSDRRERLPSSAEIPFSDSATRVVLYAIDETDRQHLQHVDVEQLLLALMREEHSAASAILTGQGLRLEAVRQQIEDLRAMRPDSMIQGHEDAVEEIDRVGTLVEQLSLSTNDIDEKHVFVVQIRDALDELKRRFR